MTIIHTADIHLKEEEKTYTLGVLQEIGEIAEAEEARAILIAGDLFDSWEDLKALRGDVCRWAETCVSRGCRILFLPGNHDILVRGDQAGSVGYHDLDALDWGPLHLMTGRPWSDFILEDDETGRILQVIGYTPREESSPGTPPRKKGAHRVLMLHAAMAGMTFTGMEEEENRPHLESPGLGELVGADYGALGHIHRKSSFQQGKTQWVYPGSATMWRRGEEGARQVSLVRFSGTPEAPRFLPLSRAGAYQKVTLSLEALKEWCDKKTPFSGDFSRQDYVEVFLEGLIPEETDLQALTDPFLTWGGKSYRRFEINTQGVIFSGGLEQEPLMKEYLDRWQEAVDRAQSQPGEIRILHKARELAFEALHEIKRDREGL